MQSPVLRTFLRRLLTTLSVLSLILCLATIGLWVRSYWWHDEFTLRTSSVLILDLTSAGGLTRVRSIPTVHLDDFGVWHHGAVHETPNSWPTFYRASYRSGDWTLIFPTWLACVLTAISPIGQVIYIRHRNQRRPGCCVNCGYDLRASPQRCPECGTTR